MKVALLAGGTGGTKLAHGFAMLEPSVELSVIANVADDLELHGLHVSPDIDALLYTLAALIDTEPTARTPSSPAMANRSGSPSATQTWRRT
jgi:LPPG:FO 2-phospho-L-lactate transferase